MLGRVADLAAVPHGRRGWLVFKLWISSHGLDVTCVLASIVRL